MKIIIDMQGAQSHSRFRGIGRYSLSLVDTLVQNYAHKHHIILLLNGMLHETLSDIRQYFSTLLPSENIKVWRAYAPTHASSIEHKNRRDAAILLHESFIASLEPDILLYTSTIEGYHDESITSSFPNLNIPYASIFYDAIPWMQKEKYITPLGKNYEIYYHEKVEILQKAHLLFGISNSSCSEAVDVLHVPKNRMTNIYASVDSYFQIKPYSQKEKETILSPLNINKNFILYTGATDERKNHIRLIEAYSLLSLELRQKYQLVIAGGLTQETHTKFKKTIKHYGLANKDIILTNRITDKELLALYNLCTLYVFPSYHEGFGLPILEAMQCGAAVIGANTTSVPEVIERDDALFDPFDANSISSKIEEVLNDKTLLGALRTHANIQSKKFSWKRSARLLMNGLEKWYTTAKQESPLKQYSERRLIQKIAQLNTLNQNDLLYLSDAIAFNHPQKEKQLLIDISELIQHDAKSGIQRVVRSILHILLQNPPEGYSVKAIYATADTYGYKYANQFTAYFLDKSNTIEDDYPIDIAAGDIFLGLDMSPNIQTFQKSYLDYLKNIGVSIHFVVYDLLLIDFPQWWPPQVAPHFEKWIQTVIEVSTSISCISQYVSSRLTQYISQQYDENFFSPHINSFHLGADINNSHPSFGIPQDSTELFQHMNNKISFLMVGTLEPRKGHMQTILAFEKLWEEGTECNLIIIGKQAWLSEKLVEKLENHPEKNKRLFWLNGISDEYLEAIYGKSHCLIVASEGEGFGLPLIEAAQKDLPIVARDIPVFKEVAGEHAYYFPNTKDPEILASSLKEWLQLYEDDMYPTSEHMPWLTWKESTTQLMKCVLNAKVV